MPHLRIPEPGEFPNQQQELEFWARSDLSACVLSNTATGHSAEVVRAYSERRADFIVYSSNTASSFYGMRCYQLLPEYRAYEERVRRLTREKYPELVSKPMRVTA